VETVDVVIVAYNSRDRIRDCVTPFLAHDWVGTIVVDNASPDRSGDAVADLPLTLVHAAENRGFGAGCNLGWRAGYAPAVLFLNPDATISAGALRTLVDALESDPQTGIVGPRIIDDKGALDYSIRRFPQIRSTFAQAVFVHRLSSGANWADEVVRDADRYETSGDADWLSGACLLVRRELLERLGGFDERFFMYCEDTDICRRAWDAGYRVRYVAEAGAEHEGGRSAPRSGLLPVLARSRVLYAELHRGGAAAAAERFGVALGALAHAAVGKGGRAVRAGHLTAAAAAIRTYT
jgi:N-acetylglucosaminyl-diphospho-decaprenol L-rhamnosyltransferase